MVSIYFRDEISLPVEAALRIHQMRKATDPRLSALLCGFSRRTNIAVTDGNRGGTMRIDAAA